METPQTTLDDVRAELIRLKEDLDVQKEIAALRMEVTLQLSYFKWAAGTAAVVLGVISFFGFRVWSDLTASARKASEKQIGEMRERYSNLSRGFSLVDSGRTASMPSSILNRCMGGGTITMSRLFAPCCTP